MRIELCDGGPQGTRHVGSPQRSPLNERGERLLVLISLRRGKAGRQGHSFQIDRQQMHAIGCVETRGECVKRCERLFANSTGLAGRRIEQHNDVARALGGNNGVRRQIHGEVRRAIGGDIVLHRRLRDDRLGQREPASQGCPQKQCQRGQTKWMPRHRRVSTHKVPAAWQPSCSVAMANARGLSCLNKRHGNSLPERLFYSVNRGYARKFGKKCGPARVYRS